MALADGPGQLDRQAGERDLREQILDAAHACVMRYGVPKTTIEDVVRAAGVSRATLYKYVPGGRDELVLEVLLREGRRSVGVVLAAMRDEDAVEDQLAAGILACAERIDGDDHLRFLFSPEIVHPRTGIAGADVALLEATAQVISPVLARGRHAGVLANDVTDADAAEWVLRMILGLLTFTGPAERSRDDLLEFVRRYAVRPLLSR